LYDHAPVGYVTLDAQMHIQTINLSGAIQLQQPRTRLLDSKFTDYVAPADQDRFYFYIQALLNSRQAQSSELQLVKADGTGLDVRLHSLILPTDKADKPNVLMTVIPINERKRIEAELTGYHRQLAELVAVHSVELLEINEKLQAEVEERRQTEARLEAALAQIQATQEQVIQQERLAAVGQLSAGIAHDFNNILTGVVGHAELLARRLAKEQHDGERSARMIMDQGKRAAQLVRQRLDFSRQSFHQSKPLNLDDLLPDLIHFWQRTIPENIELQLEIEPGDYRLDGDAGQLQQLLTNLVLNARDAMPEGGRLQLTLLDINFGPDQPPPRQGMAPGRWLCLQVADTGLGISAVELPHIFEPFFTTKPIGQGTGLGLAQVYGIIQSHTGDIEVISRVNVGTTFFLYVPPGHLEPEPTPQVPKTSLLQGQGELILVVEDEASVLEVVCRQLETLNYRVLTARNGQEALTQYQQQHAEIALVLTDLIMPVLDGGALLTQLQAVEPAVKVIIMTGYPEQKRAKQLLDQGLLEWVQKPTTLGQLAHSLGQVFGLHQAADADLS
jgi:PAS domain S-box-containing protein